MISGIRLCLGTSEAEILARAAEATAAGSIALVDTRSSGEASRVAGQPHRLGVYALRPPPDKASLLGSVALHRKSALLVAQHPSNQNAETYDQINAIATDIRVGMRLSAADRMDLLVSLIHDDNFPLTMLPYLVDVFCDLAGVLSEACLKARVREASRSFKIFLWDNGDLTDSDWVIFANETLRLFHGTPFLYQILAELYHQRCSLEANPSVVLDTIAGLPRLGAGVAGEIATAALARYPFADRDFAHSLEFITTPASHGLATKESAVYQIGVIVNGNPKLTPSQLEMLRNTVMELSERGADPILSGWTLARIAGHPNFPATTRLHALVSLARFIRWPLHAIDEFILAVAYVTRHNPRLMNIPKDLVSHLQNQGIHIGKIAADTDKPEYRTKRPLALTAWIQIWEFFRPYRQPTTTESDPDPGFERNVA